MSALTITFISICIGGGLLLMLSVFLAPGVPSDDTYVNRGTRIFLVVLRLAIGWQFLVEGVEKLNNPDWSSRGYFHAATGPLGKHFRKLADEDFLAQFDLNPENHRAVAAIAAWQVGQLGNGPLPAATNATANLYPVRFSKLPPALDKRWQNYFEKFKQEMILDRTKSIDQAKLGAKQKEDLSKHDENLIQLAKIKLDQAKAKTLLWMTTRQPTAKPSPYLERPTEMTARERVQYYQNLMKKVEEIATVNVAAFGDGAKDELLVVWNEGQQVFGDLKNDLDAQNEEMKKDLQSVLDDAVQKRLALPKMTPIAFEGKPLQWGDFIVPWGLAVVGACLIGGFFTRTNCFLGAAFLITIYLAMPPLPGWPASPRAEGNYLFINKTLIEALALLVLMTTCSGRWLGLDGFFSSCRMFFRRNKTASAGDPLPVMMSKDR